MTATLEQARDEITALFRAAWLADSVSSPYPISYDDKSDPRVSSIAPWARITVRHSFGQQHTLGGSGERVFTRTGVAIIQVFVPFGQGLLLQDRLASVARRAFEGKSTIPGNIWFTNVSVAEIGSSGAYSQVNVTANFSYDERV